MAEGHAPNHSYHLVEPSPWPIVGSVSAFVLAVGAIMWMHGSAPWIMAIGLAGVLYTMFMWWRDVVHEAHSGAHTPVVQLHMRYGMMLFIASEVMFFVAWFWAFFNAALYPADPSMAARTELFGGQFPPADIIPFNPWHLPLINTLILLTSGTTVTWAHHSLLHGDRKGLVWGLLLTIVLGVLFTTIQAYEYGHAAFAFSAQAGGNVYGSIFFMATGFHGFHVIVGTIFLTVVLFRSLAGHFTPQQHFGFEAAAWYWHFVDVVWLFLFVCIYIWGSRGAEVFV
jgi:cytochrome c oxidase subunit III